MVGLMLERETIQSLTACHDHPCILREKLLTLINEFVRRSDREDIPPAGRVAEDREAGVNTAR